MAIVTTVQSVERLGGLDRVVVYGEKFYAPHGRYKQGDLVAYVIPELWPLDPPKHYNYALDGWSLFGAEVQEGDWVDLDEE